MDISTLPVPTREDAIAAIENTRLLAAASLQIMLEDVLTTTLDPKCSLKDKKDILEFLYKVSGMASKQAEKVAGPGFTIEIIMPGNPKNSMLMQANAMADIVNADDITGTWNLPALPSYFTPATPGAPPVTLENPF